MDETKKTGVAPFVLSLLSVIFLFIPGPGTILALILGIVALVLTINARKTTQNALLTAALVLSIIGIAVPGAMLIFAVTCIGMATSIVGDVVGNIAGAPYFWDIIF